MNSKIKIFFLKSDEPSAEGNAPKDIIYMLKDKWQEMEITEDL